MDRIFQAIVFIPVNLVNPVEKMFIEEAPALRFLCLCGSTDWIIPARRKDDRPGGLNHSIARFATGPTITAEALVILARRTATRT